MVELKKSDAKRHENDRMKQYNWCDDDIVWSCLKGCQIIPANKQLSCGLLSAFTIHYHTIGELISVPRVSACVCATKLRPHAN